jgi:hypothetical protein
MDWLMGLVISLAAVAVGVMIAVLVQAQLAERELADACTAHGGIPVQGDSAGGNPVVCLDRAVVIEGTR